MTCPYLCDADGTSCTILDGTSNSPSKRATTGQCMHYPAMYYNCEWFPNKDIPNLDTATQNTMPFYRASGICINIQNYLESYASQWSPTYMGASFMRLRYKRDSLNTNRALSCGVSGTGNMAAHCAELKLSLWPLAVQQAGSSNALGMYGWSDSMSCDEFPFNSSEEGGTGANGPLPRHYTVNLFDSTNNPTGTFLGTFAGYLVGNQNLIRARIDGGVNTFGSNSVYTLSSGSYNALCHVDDGYQTRTTAMGVDYIKLILYNVVYGDSTGADLTKRDGSMATMTRTRVVRRYILDSGRWKLRIPTNWQDYVILMRRDSSDELAQENNGKADGWKWDNIDSVAFTLLSDDGQPASGSHNTSATLATRAGDEDEGNGAHRSRSASRNHYGQYFHRHAHRHH